MATVKILYNDTAEHLEKYLKEKGEDGLTTEHSCFLDGMTREFSQLQSDYNSKGNNALHLIQSWSPAESKTLAREQIHEMGVEMAKRFAPGHQFVVQTHTDRDHFHNHIVINPVSIETGKRIRNKIQNLYKVRDINDDIARERGLSVLPRPETLRQSGPNEKARRIEAYRGRSYIVDLSNKATFARNHATNYDEYLSILNGFNIQARIENQNITYFYPGRDVGKRGRNLSPQLDKTGLEEKFKQNRELIKISPDLRAVLAQWKPHASAPKLASSSDLISRRADAVSQPRKQVIDQSIIPLEEIQKAKTQSILEYCRREKIPTIQNQDGKTALKNRDHVEISEYSWINHRNKTQGNLIDFVANHRSTSLLHAVSIINDNPNLMLLEKYMGEIQRRYQTFHIPTGESATRGDSIIHLAKLLGHSPPRGGYATLFKSQRVQVTPDFKIRFFPEKHASGFLEYISDSSGNYRKQVVGDVRSPFLRKKGKGEELVVFLEPRTFLKYQPGGSGESKGGTLALLEPNLALVHQAVATHKGLKKVRIIQDPLEPESPEAARFFDELKASLDPFSIDTSRAWEAMPSPARPSRNSEIEHSIDVF